MRSCGAPHSCDEDLTLKVTTASISRLKLARLAVYGRQGAAVRCTGPLLCAARAPQLVVSDRPPHQQAQQSS